MRWPPKNIKFSPAFFKRRQDSKGRRPLAAIRRWRNSPYFRRIWGFGGLYKRKAPKAPPFCARLGGGGLPAGEVARSARGGPSYLFTGSLRRNPLLTASGLMGLEFPAGELRLTPLPTLPPRGEAGERKPRGQRPPLSASPWKGEVARRAGEVLSARCRPP